MQRLIEFAKELWGCTQAALVVMAIIAAIAAVRWIASEEENNLNTENYEWIQTRR